MIPNIVRGNDMRGLVKYLVATDERVAEKTGSQHIHQHRDPHVVGGDDSLRAWYGANVLSYTDAKDIADYLEKPREKSGSDIQRTVKQTDPETGRKVTMGSTSENVWHASLSLAPSDQLVAEEQWSEIAQQFMDQMGFTETSGHAPARWVAIHHGPGKGGRDHIHIAASMVREDGTKWDGRWNDFRHAQQAARQIEKDHNLFQVQGRKEQIRERGDRPGERETAARMNFDLTIPRELGQRLRQSAAASLTEDEFVRRARRNGLVMKPLYETGGTRVRSYQAGLHPKEMQRRADQAGVTVSRWASIRSATMLGPDLNLDRLRTDLWGQPGHAAQAEWDAAFKGQQPVQKNGPDSDTYTPADANTAAGRWGTWHDQLAAIPASNRHAWASAARDVSGAMHNYAPFSDRPADMRRAADALARSAKVVGKPTQPHTPARQVKGGSVVGTGWLLDSLRHGKQTGSNKQMMGMLINQMIRTGMAIADAHQARKAHHEADRIHQRVIGPLQAEHGRLINDPTTGQPHERQPTAEEVEADRIGQIGALPPTRRGAQRGPDVIPTDPDSSSRPHIPQKQQPERAPERGR